MSPSTGELAPSVLRNMAGKMKKPKEDPNAYKPVEDSYLDYWIANEPGGSGLSIGIQRSLKNMSIELKEFRKERALRNWGEYQGA